MGNFSSLLSDVEKRVFSGEQDIDFHGIIMEGCTAGGMTDFFLSRMRRKGYGIVRGLPESIETDRPTLFVSESEDLPENWAEHLKAIERNSKYPAKLLVVDRKYSFEWEDSDMKFFTVDVPWFASREFDIDNEITKGICSLYTNSFEAVVTREDYSFPDDCEMPFYFRTSALVEYPRARYVLTGYFASILEKPNNERYRIIVSRDIAGTPTRDEVRMWEIAKDVARLTGRDAVKLVPENNGYVPSAQIGKESVAVLDDVINTGDTAISIIESLRKLKKYTGLYITAMDLQGRGQYRLKALGVKLEPMATISDYREYIRDVERKRKEYGEPRRFPEGIFD